MRRVFSIVALCLLFSLAAFAAGSVDGKWVASVERPAARRQGGPATIEIVFDLKTDGDKLTGSISGPGRRRSMIIDDGKVAGDKISFTTTMQTRQGERKFLWEATLKDDQLQGTRTPENGRRSIPFTAKRQN